MFRRIGFVCIVIMILLAVNALAFDGERKGVVLGGGVGFAVAAHWEADINLYGLQGSVDEDEVGVAVQFVIGGAFDEHTMLVYEGNVSSFNSTLLDRQVVQGINGACLYYYFGPTGRSFFVNGGAGFYYFKVEDFEQPNAGGALLLGCGYEFTPHWQVAASLSFGTTSESVPGADAEYTHRNFNLMVSGIAF